MSESKTDLEKKIVADLKKSGFGSELAAINIFTKNDFSVLAGWAYMDKGEGKLREIDIRASLAYQPEDKAKDPYIFFTILADVKKSEKPWIILGSSPYKGIIEVSAGGLVNARRLPTGWIKLHQLLQGFAVLTFPGHGIHEFEKKPSDKSTWYSAFCSLTKAAALDAADRYESLQDGSFPFVDITKPLLILDGLLYWACIDGAGKISLASIQEGAVAFPYQTEDQPDDMVVDVITLGGLEHYLDRFRVHGRRLSHLMHASADLEKP